MPSFHVAGALSLDLGAAGAGRWLLIPVGLINIALIAATVLTGAHYAIDGIAALFIVNSSKYNGLPALGSASCLERVEKSVSVENDPFAITSSPLAERVL